MFDVVLTLVLVVAHCVVVDGPSHPGHAAGRVDLRGRALPPEQPRLGRALLRHRVLAVRVDVHAAQLALQALPRVALRVEGEKAVVRRGRETPGNVMMTRKGGGQ